MSDRTHRENVLLVPLASNATDAQFAAGYFVTAYREGGIVQTAGAASTITLHSGQGAHFAADDWVLIMTPGADYSTVDPVFQKVTSISSDTLTMGVSNITTNVGDIIVNLGGDGGSGAPDYDGSGATIWSDPGVVTEITDQTLTTNNQGGYEYWHSEDGIWELVRDASGRPVDVIIDASPQTLTVKKLDVSARFELPLYTTTTRDALSSVQNGTVIYNITQKRVNVYDTTDARWNYTDGTDATL